MADTDHQAITGGAAPLELTALGTSGEFVLQNVGGNRVFIAFADAAPSTGPGEFAHVLKPGRASGRATDKAVWA